MLVVHVLWRVYICVVAATSQSDSLTSMILFTSSTSSSSSIRASMLYLSFLLLVQLNELSKIIMSEIKKASNQNPDQEYHISSNRAAKSCSTF